MVGRSEACAWLLVSGECACVREVGWMQVVCVYDDIKRQTVVVHLIRCTGQLSDTLPYVTCDRSMSGHHRPRW